MTKVSTGSTGAKSQLGLKTADVRRARTLARQVGRPIVTLAQQHTTVSVERATLRMAGLAGADPDGTPWVNRLVDVVLSNVLHSGLSYVWLLEQTHPFSLQDHLSNGRPWDLDRTAGGLLYLHPRKGGDDDPKDGWHTGTADALWRQTGQRLAVEAYRTRARLHHAGDQVEQR